MDGSLKVLLVEDDIDQANLMQQSLRKFDSRFEVQTIHSANACLEKLSQQKYEAIILDFHLPEKNGLEILHEISNNGINTPVVVVSGNGSEQIAVEALRRGANDYLVKDSNYISLLPKVVQKTIEQHHLEIRLRETERKYQNIFENGNDAILIIDPGNYEILDANIKTSKILGYTRDELIGKVFFDLYPEYQHALVKEVFANTNSDGENNDDTLLIISKDGQSIPVDVTASVIRFGRTDCILCNVKNIAEKKHLQTLILNSKKRLQNTFDGITDIIFQVNQDYEIVIANKKFAELYKDEPEKVIGKRYYQLFCNRESPCIDCPVKRTFENFEPKFLEKTRNDKIYEVWSYPIFSVDGRLEAVAVYSKDVTEKKKLERTLIQSEKMATIGLLASGIAHELRNPLNVIETARYYIEEFLVEKDPDISAKLDIIRKNVRRSSKIINNLLEFSRHPEHERENIDLKPTIENTVSLIKKELDAKNIEFVFSSEGNYRTYFSVDSLKQVLLNLIINAIQAMQNGGQLKIEIEQNQPKLIDIKIADTGIGIQEENLPHIFSPFFTTKEVGQGTGLGLYISHMIIEREGGLIKVDSKVNVGTTFTITLPVMAEN